MLNAVKHLDAAAQILRFAQDDGAARNRFGPSS